MNFLKPIILAIAFSVALLFRLLIFLPFYFWKYCVQLVGSHSGFGLRKIISSNHYLGPDGRLLVSHNLVISFQLSGLVNVHDFRNTFLDKCILKRKSITQELEFPELTEKIVVWGGYPFWQKNENFDIKYHILDWTVNEENIVNLENEILTKEFLKEDGSPWRIYLIHDKFQESTRLIFSFHHSLGDGASMNGLLMRLSNIQENGREKPTLALKVKNAVSALRNLLPPRNPLLCPVPLIKNFLKCSTTSPSFHLKADEMTDVERMIVKSSLITKSTITMIAKENQVPFTAVLLSAISGALRKYLLDSEVESGGPCSVPDFVLCPMPIPMHHNKGLSNAVQNIDLALPLGTEDLGQRLQKCGETIRKAQTSAFPLFVRLLNITQNAFPLTLKPGTAQLPAIILSCFPGPKTKVEMVMTTSNKSHEILDMDFTWNGCNYISVAITTLTYTDGIRLVLSADPKTFKHSSSVFTIMDSIEREINNMHHI